MKRIRFFIFSLILALAVMAEPFYVVAGQPDNALTLHFIDVGQGDSCIIELPDGRNMLIDAGENKDKVKEKLNSYISQNFNTKDFMFDFVIMTHSDRDHIGSMEYVLSNYKIGTVYRPNQQCTYSGCDDPANSQTGKTGFWAGGHGQKSTLVYHEALKAAYQNAKEVIVTNPYDNTQNEIKSTNENKYEINFYSPLSADYSDNNNYSPIIVIEYGGKNIVLTGDAEAKNESEFVDAVKTELNERYKIFKDFSADVIKLGHHGSKTSSSSDYLNIVTKASKRKDVFVIISCGINNQYGHPNAEVLERLANLGFDAQNILRTDVLGDIVISVEQENGQFVVKYGDKVSGVDNEDPISGVIKWFKSLDTYVKIIIIVAVLIILAIALYIIFRPKKNKKRRNNL